MSENSVTQRADDQRLIKAAKAETCKNKTPTNIAGVKIAMTSLQAGWHPLIGSTGNANRAKALQPATREKGDV
jgi:hypothetical protein